VIGDYSECSFLFGVKREASHRVVYKSVHFHIFCFEISSEIFGSEQSHWVAML